ncbi:MAG: 7-carboxy-7-deazaguanine synthase QueE [Candidatus Woesearchaeota archaeon]
MTSKINVNEIYGPVVQGEGKRTGVRSSFVRTNACNLKCAWTNSDGTITKCDTPYTSWFPEQSNMQTADEIVGQLRQYEQNGEINDVIISGGEPMMQGGIEQLIQQLIEQDKFVTVETNGTIYKELGENHPHLYSISPKLDSATPFHDDKAAKIHIRNNVLDNSIPRFVDGMNKGHFDAQFKFVYNEPADIEQIEQFRDKYSVGKDKIWLMPQGDTLELQIANTQRTMDEVINNGYNMSTRLHILAYSDKRGV